MIMNKKLLHLLVIMASLIGYLEWGNKQHLFIFQAEAQIFYSLLKHPSSVFHPLVVLPFLGQLLLATNMFKPASRGDSFNQTATPNEYGKIQQW